MYIENNYLIIDNFFKPKKITATNFYGLLGENKFKPKGDYLLSVFNLLKEPFDQFYMKRGDIAEKILNRHLQLNGNKTKTWNKFEINFDNFPKNPEFGGMIDIAIIEPYRCVVECKSKNIKDFEKIKRFPNLEQEYQALFYGYMSKCPKVKIFYVFFNDEQEERIRKDLPIDIENEHFDIYEKDLTYTNDDIESKMKECLEYKKKCISEKRIPIEDISDKALSLLGIKRS